MYGIIQSSLPKKWKDITFHIYLIYLYSDLNVIHFSYLGQRGIIWGGGGGL